ncbi:MAG TPA: right-handed parallel beta-helix repeat-containing protein [Planctomycetota bacterium]
MRTTGLLAALLLVPACGGGGDDGPSWTAFFPPIPTSGTGGTVGGGFLAPLAIDGSAVTHTIPTAGDDASVRTALQGILDGPGSSFVINFDNGGPRTVVLSEQIRVPPNKALVLDGQGTLTLSGGLNNRILLKRFNTTVTLQRLTFVDGRADDNGGAIEFEDWDGRLTVIDCVFTNCRTRNPGPDRGGGAIRAWGQRHTRISGCVFTDCQASNGGAVNSLGSQLTIINSRFERNVAFGTGGGAEVGGGGGIGGAVYIDNVHLNADAPEFNLSGSVFRNNVANAHAGAVFGYTTAEDVIPPDLAPVSLTRVDACTFSGNQVTGQGGGGGHSGAFYSQNGTRVFEDSTFDGNVSANVAGGVFVTGAGDVGFTNCTLRGNAAAGLGGALFLSGGTTTLMNVTIAENSSALFAGGIFRGGASVTMTNSLLQNNTGTDLFNGWNVNQALSGGSNNLQWPQGGATNPAALPGITFANAGLQALGANGGNTRTMAITGVPAAGGGTSTGAPSADQRGQARGNPPDVGAYELP